MHDDPTTTPATAHTCSLCDDPGTYAATDDHGHVIDLLCAGHYRAVADFMDDDEYARYHEV